jgi:hypothetical protein
MEKIKAIIRAEKEEDFYKFIELYDIEKYRSGKNVWDYQPNFPVTLFVLDDNTLVWNRRTVLVDEQDSKFIKPKELTINLIFKKDEDDIIKDLIKEGASKEKIYKEVSDYREKYRKSEYLGLTLSDIEDKIKRFTAEN